MGETHFLCSSGPRCSNGSSSSHHPGALFDSKHGASSSSLQSTLPPLPLLLPPPPSVPRPPGALDMSQSGGPPDKLYVEQALKASPTEVSPTIPYRPLILQLCVCLLVYILFKNLSDFCRFVASFFLFSFVALPALFLHVHCFFLIHVSAFSSFP